MAIAWDEQAALAKERAIRRVQDAAPQLLAACKRLVYAEELGSTTERHLAIQEAQAAIDAAEKTQGV